MADYQQKVELVIGGDSTAAVEALQRVKDKTKELHDATPDKLGKTGKDGGEQFGRELYNAQKKWLNLSQSLLSQYGGRVGRILSGLLGQFGKLADAQRASQRLPSGVGGRAGAEIAGTAGGDFAGEVLATGTGVSASRGLSRWWSRRRAFRANLRLRPGEKSSDFGLSRDESDAITSRANNVRRRRGDVSTIFSRWGWRKPMSGTEIQTPYTDPKNPGVFRPVPSGAPRPAMGALRNLAGRGLAGAGGSLVTGIVSGAAIAVTGLVTLIGGLASKYDELKAKQTEVFGKEGLIKEIEAIKDPVERTKKILEEFGKDGLAKFREMKDEVVKLREEVGSKEWRTSVNAAYMAWSGMKEFWRDNVWTPIKNVTASATSWIMQKITGVTEEMVAQMEEGERRILEMQQRVDAAREKAAEEKDKADKLTLDIQKEINDRTWEELDAVRQLGLLTDFVNKLQEQKNRSLEEELALQRAITDANKLREGMEPPSVLDPTGMNEADIPKAVKDYNKGMNTLLNPLARENNPTLLGYQKRADEIQKERQKRADGISLANEFNRINYQRGQVGLKALTPEERMKIAENRMLNEQASKENLDPMQILADSFREHGALIVKPIFSN